jgi:ParB-like chromosome segregation protein Spo0J
VTIPFHPYADIFPMMTPQEQMGLADDIRAHGLRNKIVVHEGAILDGRNRYQACLMAGVDPAFVEFDDSGADALNFVMSLNMHRRHLTDGERATAAAKLANIRFGDNQHTLGSANLQTHAISQSEAAKSFDVSTRLVASAAKVLKEGAPELVAAMERGEVKVSAAADLSKLPVEKQPEIVTAGPAAVVEAAKTIRETPKEIAQAEPVDCEGDNDEVVDLLGDLDFDGLVKRWQIDRMPRGKALALSNMIYHRAYKDREREAARWIWQYRQGVALSHPATHDDGCGVKLVKDPKAEAAIRAIARKVNANGRSKKDILWSDLCTALEKTDLMGNYLGRLSVIAFCYWAIVQKAPTAGAEPFFDEIAKGPSRHLQDARYVAATALFNGRDRLSPNDMAETILRGWINYRTGIGRPRKRAHVRAV